MSNRRFFLERAAQTAALVVFFAGGYFFVAASVPHARAHSLHSPIDAWIPFLPNSVFVYFSVYPLAFSPLFVLRSRKLFRRVAAAYALVIAVSLTCFALYPVTSVELRPEPSSVEAGAFTAWSLALLYAYDPPVNLFPSLHLAIVVVAALAARRARPAYGALGMIWASAVAVSVCTVKQHFVLDAVAGIALAGIAYACLIRPLPQPSPEHAYYAWPIAALYVAGVGLCYGLLYAVYARGLGGSLG